MRRYNLLQPFWLAFYSKALYKDVCQHWRGGAVFTYLLLLILFCTLPFAYIWQTKINHLVQEIQPWFNQLPAITITNNEVSIDKPVPFYIKNPETQQIVAIIDTSGATTTLTGTTAQFLLTKNQLIYRKNSNTVGVYKLNEFNNQSYTGEEIYKLVKKTGNVIMFFLFPLILLLYYLQGLLEALVYAALAKVFIRTALTYNVLVKLAIIAITPKFILVTVLGLFGLTVPYKWILYFALGMGYLFFAIEANRKE